MITASRAREISAGDYSLQQVEECINHWAKSRERYCMYNYNYLDDTNNIIDVLTQQGFKVKRYPAKSILYIEW